MDCGKPEPAPEEDVILQFTESEIIKHLTTGKDATLNMEGLLEKMDEDAQVNIFVKKDGEITYITTIDRSGVDHNVGHY